MSRAQRFQYVDEAGPAPFVLYAPWHQPCKGPAGQVSCDPACLDPWQTHRSNPKTIGTNSMHENVMSNDIRAIESLMEMTASVVEKLNSLIQIEAPVKPMGLSSDCCTSNNYPEER